MTPKINDQKPHLQVAAAVLFEQGRVLISRRPEGSHLGGMWEFPGGKQEQGEDLEACLEREMIEELGLKVKVEKFLLTVEHEYDTRSISLHFFECSLLEGQPRAISVQDFQWVAPSDLHCFRFPPPDSRLISLLQTGEMHAMEGKIMFYKKTDDGYKTMTEGVLRKTLVFGEKTLLSEFKMKKGSSVPFHSHPHEQAGYLISGRVRFTSGDEVLDAFPGDSWCVPGGQEHKAEVLEDAVMIEVFSPVREEYL